MAKFQGPEWFKHDYKYSKGVLNDILNGKNIFKGDVLNQNDFIPADIFDKNKVADLLDKINNYQQTNFLDLDDCVINFAKSRTDWFPNSRNVWTSIFKGVYSKHEEGVKNNKGNAFEFEFQERFDSYYKNLMIEFADEIGDLNLAKTLETCNSTYIEQAGKNNSPRPLIYTDNAFELGGKNKVRMIDNNIGAIIADVVINPPFNQDPLYLSLKYSRTFTLINTGLSTLFPDSMFEAAIDLGNDISLYDDIPITIEGEALLNMFGIDKNRFISVYANYDESLVKKLDYDCIDVTFKCNKEMIGTFVKSAIGHGYIIVHKSETVVPKIDFTDLRTEDNVCKYLGCSTNFIPNKVVVEYPSDNSKKRVNVRVTYRNKTLLFVLRNKSGKVYPLALFLEIK